MHDWAVGHFGAESYATEMSTTHDAGEPHDYLNFRFANAESADRFRAAFHSSIDETQ